MTKNSGASNDLYAGFPVDVRQELAHHQLVIIVPQGTQLLKSGTCPDQLIILNSGTVETCIPVPRKMLSLGIADPGRVFGLPSIMSGVPTDTTVTCLERCEVTLLPKTAFLDILGRNPRMYLAVARVLSRDLAAADRAIRTHARGSAR